MRVWVFVWFYANASVKVPVRLLALAPCPIVTIDSVSYRGGGHSTRTHATLPNLDRTVDVFRLAWRE